MFPLPATSSVQYPTLVYSVSVFPEVYFSLTQMMFCESFFFFVCVCYIIIKAHYSLKKPGENCQNLWVGGKLILKSMLMSISSLVHPTLRTGMWCSTDSLQNQQG